MRTNPDHADFAPVPAHADEFTRGLLPPEPDGGLPHLTQHSLLQEIPPASPTTSPDARFIACMVTHGIGQQVPFQTVSMIGEAFVKGRTPRSVQANRVQLTPGADLLSRLELVYEAFHDPDSGVTTPETHVHLYEGYWASLVAGKITYAQSLTFLFSGAGAGIMSSVKRRFNRWIFGKMYDLPVKKHTFWILLLVLLILLLGLLLAYLGGLEIALAWGALKKELALAQTGGLWAAVVTTFEVLKHSYIDSVGTVVLVLLALGYRYVLRVFIIDYLGSVAIYVSSYKVSAFEDVRNAIQKAVFTVGSQIFESKMPSSHSRSGAPLYDKVIFLGHSLGSVITYDMINALIVWDSSIYKGAHNVLGRTQQIVTFGSPLDKTAFLFRTQISPQHHYREALAALQQPIVLDYRLRPFPWINLHACADIVSGKLQYYDVPAPKPTGQNAHPLPNPLPPHFNPVANFVDPDAWFPIYAHLQYWKGKMLRDLLQKAIR